METPLPRFFFFFLFLFLDSSRSGLCHGAVLPHVPRSVNHRLRKPSSTVSSSSSSSSGGHGSSGPYNFFEVARPVGPGAAEPDCSVLVLQHAFANTYSLPPAMARYGGLPAGCEAAAAAAAAADRSNDGRRNGPMYPRIVLRWSGRCKGRQYDRIAGLWFGGVELLRTCTAEPTAGGVEWEVRKDVTRYASLLMQAQDVVLELANVVDATYTGIFYINVTLEFFFVSISEGHGSSHGEGEGGKLHPFSHGEGEGGKLHPFSHGDEEGSKLDAAAENLEQEEEEEKEKNLMKKKKEKKKKSDWPPTGPADMIVPISQPDAVSGQGHWFHITSGGETAVAAIAALPASAVRAVLELCVSFHGDDEFWYTNPPNEYLEANGLTGQPGNGPFREVEVLLLLDADAENTDTNTDTDTDANADDADDADTDTDTELVLGAAWPFPTVFTGGINPLFWRPAAAIGAFALPSYDLDLTPFLGLLAGGDHNRTIGFRVRNANGSWPLDANLHLWLDPAGAAASARLLAYDAPPPSVSHSAAPGFSGGLDGEFRTAARRSLSFSASVSSATFGHALVNVSYSLAFDNLLAFYNASAVQVVTQSTETLAEVTSSAPSSTPSPSASAGDPGSAFWQQRAALTFPLYLYCSIESGAGDDAVDSSTYAQVCNLTHSFIRSSSIISTSRPPDADVDVGASDSLNNWQAAQGSLEVIAGSLTSGIGALQQLYAYESTYPGCYRRSLSTRNYSILYDATSMSCGDDSLVSSL